MIFLRLNRSFSLIVFVFFIAGAGEITRGLARPATFELQYSALLKQAPSIDPRALQTALIALGRLQDDGFPVRSDVLMVIDYTKPSTERRLWVFDLNHSHVLFEELVVAHGRNSGGNRAVQFSNQPGSLMSSLGVFLTAGTYIGKHGLSLRLQGLEKGVNDKSMERAIVIHAAEYVSERVGRREGRIGRSWGCPAVRPEVSRQLIETVQGGALLLAYYPENSWLQTSKLARPLEKTPAIHTRA
jgi:hypothetical protein